DPCLGAGGPTRPGLHRPGRAGRLVGAAAARAPVAGGERVGGRADRSARCRRRGAGRGRGDVPLAARPRCGAHRAGLGRHCRAALGARPRPPTGPPQRVGAGGGGPPPRIGRLGLPRPAHPAGRAAGDGRGAGGRRRQPAGPGRPLPRHDGPGDRPAGRDGRRLVRAVPHPRRRGRRGWRRAVAGRGRLRRGGRRAPGRGGPPGRDRRRGHCGLAGRAGRGRRLGPGCPQPVVQRGPAHHRRRDGTAERGQRRRRGVVRGAGRVRRHPGRGSAPGLRRLVPRRGRPHPVEGGRRRTRAGDRPRPGGGLPGADHGGEHRPRLPVRHPAPARGPAARPARHRRCTASTTV
ncbi:MAG: Two-component system sensor histidine kinase, partial [uncultured Corynebacteriales bacterium]